MNVQAIKSAISPARLSTYEAACPQDHNKELNALRLYAWNAQVSAALLAPLHICEVVTRNAVAEALEAIYGNGWPWSQSFEQSLPSPRVGYNPSADLFNTRQRHTTTGKVIPELKFVFWQKLFTRRFDHRIWTPHLNRVFPNLPAGRSVGQNRELIYAELDHIRILRNRIAHHEPIISRNLTHDLQRISTLILYRCSATAAWWDSNHDTARIIQSKPQF